LSGTITECGSLTCEILRDGKLVASADATGMNATATCKTKV
jgi:hypothetical protein